MLVQMIMSGYDFLKSQRF